MPKWGGNVHPRSPYSVHRTYVSQYKVCTCTERNLESIHAVVNIAMVSGNLHRIYVSG